MHLLFRLIIQPKLRLNGLYFLFIFIVSVPTNIAHAEQEDTIFSFKGFGTLAVTGTDTDAIGFRRDISTARGATTSWSIPTDSRLGLQIDANFNEHFSATGQWVLRDRSGQFFEQNLDLAFLRWNIRPDLVVRIGRVSPDIFMLSDHRNVSYAYPWMRPPHEFYGFIPFYHFDGIDITKKFELDGGLLTLKLFGGYSFYQLQLSETRKNDQGGAVFSSSAIYEKGDWKGRISYFQLDISHLSPENPIRNTLLNPAFNVVWPTIKSVEPLFNFNGTTIRYGALGFAYDDGIWQGQAEASYVDSGNHPLFPNRGSGYLSLGRRFSSVTLTTLLGISKSFDRNIKVPNPLLPDPSLLTLQKGLDNAINNNGVDEKSISLGLRWDFYTNMAFKAQWSHYWLGDNGTQNWVEDPVQTPPDEANVISVGIDFVF